MKKILIRRKDHEVYFIERPVTLKATMEKAYVREQLEKLHPGFSSSTVFDLHHIVYNSVRFIMVTVMESAILAEYRILHTHTTFYTNTSIAAHKKDFIHEGITDIDDERIGFDTEKNLPLSIPLEEEVRSCPPALTPLLGAAPLRQGVFRKKFPYKKYACIAAIAFIMCGTFFIWIVPEKAPPEPPREEIVVAPEAEITYLPSAMEIVAEISRDTIEAGGEIENWHYDDGLLPLLSIQVLNLEVSKVHDLYSRYEYVYLEDIQNVEYHDGKPHITIHLLPREEIYTIPILNAFPLQTSILPVSSEISTAFHAEKIAIISESLPARGTGNDFYQVTYTAQGGTLVKSFEIISRICESNPVRVKALDIAISSDKTLFTVICVLSYCEEALAAGEWQGGDEAQIPFAFGYKEKPPVVHREETQPASPPPETPRLGSIRGGGGEVIFYRDQSDGKIKTRGKNE